jgi:phosphoglycerol transferase MdoB-like AlkP superfamily enzyme
VLRFHTHVPAWRAREHRSTARSLPLPDLTAFGRDARVRLAVLFFGLVMATLSLERLALFLVMKERFGAAHASEVLQAFWLGLRFDGVVASMLAAPLVVLFLVPPTSVLSARRLQHLLQVLLAAALALVVFFSLVDFYFFLEFDERLDIKALDYAGTDYVLGILWDQFPVVPVGLAALGSFAGAFVLFRRVLSSKSASFSYLRGAAAALVAAPLLLLGIRSSFGPKAINSGLAYFSDSISLAQLTLNGLFTLREALDSRFRRHEALADKLELLPESEAVAIARELVATPGDRFVDDPLNPLRRVTDTGIAERPLNVVLVVMESLSSEFVSCMQGPPALTPHLDELAAHGLLMDRCYAVGSRTPYGFCGTVAGFPDLPGGSVTTRSAAEGTFFTLGSVLAERGYETLFIYGGDPLYDHRKAFLRTNGFSSFVFGDDFTSRTFRTHLGWCDEDLYSQTHEALSAQGERPLLAVLLTLSFHRPYAIPAGRVEPVDPSVHEAERLTAVRYADWAIGRFLEQARSAEYFERTLFVFVADHAGGPCGDPDAPLAPSSYRVPFLIYAPGVIGDQGRRVSTVCSQTWVAPTILSLLGGSYEHTFFGSSVLDRPPEAGWALMLRTNRAMAFMDANEETLIVPFGAQSRWLQTASQAALLPLEFGMHGLEARRVELERRSVALLQTAELVFNRGAYNLHERR